MLRDGHVRVLPIHVANKIAAGEVVERPASVVKELVENALDAGASSVRITISQGGRKLVAVQDDGCGMTRDDAVLSLERQATSKISDVDDIERIDTLGFRGEAIPSIASVSRFSITTRRKESDEGTFLQVNAGTLAEVRAAGCPPGTLVEVRDLFCNVPARRKFLRAYATEESHVRHVFTVHALAHPAVAFSLVVDGREIHRLAPATNLADRVRDLFGPEFLEALLPLAPPDDDRRVRVTGFVERPNLFNPTRREQYVFVNGRPATAPSVAYALREAYPRRPGEVRPATILMIDLPPTDVDVNVHPTKREVRFRDNVAVKQAVAGAIATAFSLEPLAAARGSSGASGASGASEARGASGARGASDASEASGLGALTAMGATPAGAVTLPRLEARRVLAPSTFSPSPVPVQQEITIEVSHDGRQARPWKWFAFLAQTSTGYLLVETDEGIVTINPVAARERLAYERLVSRAGEEAPEIPVQTLLLPETVRLSPGDAARLKAALPAVRQMGFQIEEFGANVFKIDALPQLLGTLSPSAVLTTIAQDLAEAGAKRGDRWREELIAKSVSKSYAGAAAKMTAEGARTLVEELSAARMPYISPRGKPVMNFMSNRELNRKFDRA